MNKGTQNHNWVDQKRVETTTEEIVTVRLNGFDNSPEHSQEAYSWDSTQRCFTERNQVLVKMFPILFFDIFIFEFIGECVFSELRLKMVDQILHSQNCFLVRL